MRILRTPELRNGAKAGSLALVDDVTMLCPDALPVGPAPIPATAGLWLEPASLCSELTPSQCLSGPARSLPSPDAVGARLLVGWPFELDITHLSRVHA